MANGSINEKIARADRIREQSAKDQTLARQHHRAMENAVSNIRSAELPGYREEMDSEVTVNTKGIHARGVPRWALGTALLVLAIAGAVVAVLRFVR